MKLLMTSLLLISFSSSAFAIDYFGTKPDHQNKDVIRIDSELFMHMSSETPRQRLVKMVREKANDPVIDAMSDDEIMNAVLVPYLPSETPATEEEREAKRVAKAKEAADFVRREFPEMKSKNDLEIMDMLIQTTQD